MNHVTAIVHDQCSNMELSGDISEEEFSSESLSCVAHRLQMCIEEGLSVTTIARAIGAAKKLVGHFRHSALASDALQKRQEVMGSPQRDCPTRWNSTYYMIRSLLENRWPVTAVLSDEAITQQKYH